MSDPLIRTCQKCGAKMRYVGELPAVSIKPAVLVFRCHACNTVETV